MNKGDDINPEYRSRLLVQEIKNDKREDLFAATPPLEAKKILLSMAVTEGIRFKSAQRRVQIGIYRCPESVLSHKSTKNGLCKIASRRPRGGKMWSANQGSGWHS